MKLAVSILSSNYDEKETIERINNTNATLLHVDVMDGKFVLEKSKPYEYLHLSKKKLQVHLMVSDPFNYINQYALANTDSITLSSEIENDLESLIDYIKNIGIKVGLAIKPETNVETLNPYIDKLDEVLVLTVHPGKGGQKMLVEVLPKIDELKKIREDRNLSFDIVIDGGVNDDTIKLIKDADIAVSGSYICKSEDYNSQIEKLNL